MKKAFFILAAVCAPLLFQSNISEPPPEEIPWEDWNTGYPRAVREKKIVLVDAYTDWCGWCKKMDRDTYSNAEVIRKVKKYFVPIKFNPELNKTYYIDSAAFSGPQLHSMLSQNQRFGFPTTYFIITSKNTIYIQPGYQNSAEFLDMLDKMIESAGLK